MRIVKTLMLAAGLSFSAAAAHAADTVRVSLFSWPGYGFWFIAQEKNLVPDLDLEITIIEDPYESFSLMSAGALDVTSSTAEYGPIAADKEVPVKLVTYTNPSYGTDKIVLAGRAQVGSVLGSSAQGTAPDLLFFSGGADTVRGQPYQSLGIPVGNDTAGGRSFLGLSAEVRTRDTSAITVVGFYDYGMIGAESFVTGDDESQSGAGLGVRYSLSGIGAIRLDVAYPVHGDTSDGLQFYIGIGQAF